MKVKKSEFKNGWYGIFDEDECGHPEELVSMTKEKMIKFLEESLKFIKNKQPEVKK